MYILFLVISMIASLGSPHASPDQISVAARAQSATLQREEVEALAEAAAYFVRAIPRAPTVVKAVARNPTTTAYITSSQLAEVQQAANASGRRVPDGTLVRFRLNGRGGITAELNSGKASDASLAAFDRALFAALGNKDRVR